MSDDVLSNDEIGALLGEISADGPTLENISYLSMNELGVLVKFCNPMVLATAIKAKDWDIAEHVFEVFKPERLKEFKAYYEKISPSEMAVAKAQNVVLTTFDFLRESERL